MRYNAKCMWRATSFLMIIKIAIIAQIPLHQFVSMPSRQAGTGAQSKSACKMGLPSFHVAKAKEHLAAFLSHEPLGLSIQKAINLVSRSNKQILRTSSTNFARTLMPQIGMACTRYCAQLFILFNYLFCVRIIWI